MMQFLITGALIAFGAIVYSAWNSDTPDRTKKLDSIQDGEKGCMWLFIFLGAIILFSVLRSIT